MNKTEHYDLTYVTIDSLSEGVGSSQITPLISRLSKSGLRINLISFEKANPSDQLGNYFKSIGVEWNLLPFGSDGAAGGVARLLRLRDAIQKTSLIHARSDIPAVSAIASPLSQNQYLPSAAWHLPVYDSVHIRALPSSWLVQR